MPDRGERIVVVGTGGAGLRAAERVRELNFVGELVIIGDEPYRPYHRPMLSKQVLTGAIRARDVLLPTHSDLGAIWRPKTRVSRLDSEEHVVYLPGGEEIDYDGLIIATGMQPGHLPGAPRHDPRVHVLRNINDAIAIQKQLAGGKGRVALIGGGLLAGEVASAARELGRDTTIICREHTMLEDVPGYDVSETMTALQEANGVRLVTDATVLHWHTESTQGVTMHLSTGEVVVADCVVLCVGGVPATDWLHGSGLFVDDGVLCGPTTHALGADDVVAAGDVARWPNHRFDTVPRRVEHWMNAVEMGRAAAEALLAGKEAARPFTPLPKFWSEQHGVRIQAAGIPTLAQDTVGLTKAVPIGSKITGYVAGGELVGILAWDSPRGMLHYSHVLNFQTNEAMRRRIEESESSEAPAPEIHEYKDRPTRTRPGRPRQPLQQRVPEPIPTMAPVGARQLPVRPPMPRPDVPDHPSFPSMPPASSPIPLMAPANASLRSMPPVHPSFPSMPPVTGPLPAMGPSDSNPGMPPVGPPPMGPNASNPGMPPVGPPPMGPNASNPGLPPVGPPPMGPNASNPGLPPASGGIPNMGPANRAMRSGPPEASNPGMPPVGPPPMGPNASNPGMPPVGRPPMGPNASNPGMPPVGPPPMGPANRAMRSRPPEASNPGMPPVGPPPMGPNSSNPAMPHVGPNASNPGMPPAGRPPMGPNASNPGMPPVGPPPMGPNASYPGMPPATASHPGMPPAMASNPGMPPVNPGHAPMYAPLHSSMTGPFPAHAPDAVPAPLYEPSPVDPARYDPPMSGPADSDPAIMELPPIHAWRKAS
jgi:NADPH-dependent 2,4-dienoyl-CoA reductase/sulfur reductase-like enzyme